MATGEITYNPPLEGGSVETKDDGASVVAATTAIDFRDGTGFEFVVTDQGSGVTRVVGNVTGGSSGAPDNATYVTLTTNGTLTNERTLAVETNVLTLTDGGAGAAATIAVAATGITAAKLAADAVETAKIKDLNVTTGKLADTAVTTAKITDANVTFAKIQNFTARSALVRAANSTGVSALVSGGGANTLLHDDGTTLAFRVVDVLPEDLSLPGDISPTQLTGDVNDYNPTNLATASVLRLDSDATRTITGIAGGADGRVLLLLNIGSNSIVLDDASASSSAANRFEMGGDRTLATKEGIALWYDSTSSRWRTFSQAPGAGGGAPANATYLTLSTNGSLSDERVATATARVTITDAGAGGAATFDIGAASITDGYLAADSVITAKILDLNVTTGKLAANAVTTAKVTDANITYAKIQDVAALSVVGRSANSTGVSAAITAANDDEVLRRSGTSIGFGTIAAGGIASNAVTTAKVLDANVTDAKLADMTARSLKGRSANSTGVPGTISGAGANTFASDDGSTVAFRVVDNLPEDVALSGDLSPAQITSNQNDYNPTNLATASVLRLDTDASRTITGIAGGADGRVLFVMNIGAQPLVLANESASSSAANRMALGADRTLAAKDGLPIWYDSTSSRWRPVVPAAGSGAPSGSAGGDLGGTYPNPTVAQSSTAFALTGTISPSQITSNQNDYNPTSLSTAVTLRLDTDASRNITGLQGGATGRIIIIHNVGSNPIVLKDADTNSSAANRFALTADVTLAADAVAVLQYDGTSSRWRAVSGGGAAATTTKYLGGMTNFFNATVAPGADQITAIPFYLPQTMTVQDLRIFIGTAAGNIRLALYNSLSTGYPDDLQCETASTAAAAGWMTIIPSTTPSLAAGQYWIACINSSGTLTIRQGQFAWQKVYANHTYGAAPDPFPATNEGNDGLNMFAVFTP